MGNNATKTVKNSLGRALFVGLSLVIQVGWFVLFVQQLQAFYLPLATLMNLLALILALRIFGTHRNSSVKTSWIVLLLVFPVFGLCLYLLVGRADAVGVMRSRFDAVHRALEDKLPQDPAVLARLEQQDLAIANQTRYIHAYGGYPVYQNTDVAFYAQASDALEAQKEALRAAQHFIFMEYHAIEDGASFHALEEILADRAAQGVEVRLFYDDMGSIGFISSAFLKRMEGKGIHCRVFNPLLPFVNVFMNNRDHRKITVVDGTIGFTGGYNLADEYFNLTHPYGHWKDSGVRLTGDGVRSLTVMFLEMWNAMVKLGGEDYDAYLPPSGHTAQEGGWVQPYADTPLDGERVGEGVYMNLIKNAKRTLYVMTPYLILDDEMTMELNLAAKRGVDVRIVTPGIPDKKLVYKVTRSYYAGLAQSGVRIYEYTPGFVHAKQMIADGEAAAVGTINLDYRSLYHHFENGAYLYGCSAVRDIGADFADTFPLCAEVTQQYTGKRSAVLRSGQCLLRLFAPLM